MSSLAICLAAKNSGVPAAGLVCASFMSALFRDGCLRNTIVVRERAGTHFKKVASAEVVVHD